MNTSAEIVAPVTFRHKGLPERIESSICTNREWEQRVSVPHWDMTSPPGPITLRQFSDCDVFMNVASESHVDRSISDPSGFIMNNTLLMLNILDVARKVRPEIFLQMSTDEVYGPASDGYRHREWDVIAPSNPYAASKAAQEAVCFSYWRTYDLPIVITNTMNIIGEMQSAEKMFPMCIRKIRDGQPITVHCAQDGTPGSRFYLHARNLADAWLWLVNRQGDNWDLQRYSDGSVRPSRFNIVGEREIDNITLVKMIADSMGKELLPGQIQRVDFHSSRPGHDLRYALDDRKIKSIGWFPPVSLDTSLKKAVEWTMANQEWLET